MIGRAAGKGGAFDRPLAFRSDKNSKEYTQWAAPLAIGVKYCKIVVYCDCGRLSRLPSFYVQRTATAKMTGAVGGIRPAPDCFRCQFGSHLRATLVLRLDRWKAAFGL
jgi:hypothetical protein